MILRTVRSIALGGFQQVDNDVRAGIRIERRRSAFVRDPHHAHIVGTELDPGARDGLTRFVHAQHSVPGGP